MLAPAGPAAAGQRSTAAILVFVSDPGQEIASDLAVLTELSGFTPAEDGRSWRCWPASRRPNFTLKKGVTYNTTKTLLAQAMAHTETHSRIELVLLVAGAFRSMASSWVK